MNQNTDCEPGCLMQNQPLTSPTGTNSHKHSKILWKAFPEEWRLLKPQMRGQLPFNVHGQHRALKTSEYIWDVLEHRWCPRSSHPTSVLYLTNFLLAKCAKIPTVMRQNLVESVPRRMEAGLATSGRSAS